MGSATAGNKIHVSIGPEVETATLGRPGCSLDIGSRRMFSSSEARVMAGKPSEVSDATARVSMVTGLTVPMRPVTE